MLSCFRLFATPWTVAHQANLPMGIPQARIPRWVVMPSSRGSSQPRDRSRSPAVQADPLLSEPPGKPINTGVASLSLLQGVFPTQESSQGLLHCRRILYQLSHQGSPSYITGLHFAIFMIFWKIVSFSCVPIIEPTWLFSRVFYLKTSFPSVYASECFINDLYKTDN